MPGPTYQGVRRRTPREMRALHVKSRLGALRDGGRYEAMEHFALFAGYARSGHTVLASILDAHPDAIVANELDAVGFLERGFSRAQILHMINVNARETAAAGNEWTGYDYSVPGGWQGRVREPLVMGDKKAGVTLRRLMKDPGLLERLRGEMRVPLRILHVVRNPYDHVVARARQHPDDPMSAAIETLAGLYAGAAELRARVDTSEWLDLRSEELIANPETTIRRVLDFVGLEPEDAFVEAAAGIVMKSESRRRDTHEWTDEERAKIEACIHHHDFL
jgi:hypothetical protein